MEETAAMGCCLGGRNFDLTYSPALVVETAPDNGYRSISTVNLAFLGFGEDKLPDTWKQKLITLAAPYAPLDGINEKGLAVAVLRIADEPTDQDTGKTDITTTTAIRLMLDKAATVDEAVSLLEQYDMHSSAGSCYHFQLADAAGNSAVVEYIDNEFVVLKADEGYQMATNFLLSDKKFNFGTGQDRYGILESSLNRGCGVVKDEQAGMDLLQAASKDWHVSETVSYTHLDVYKRQFLYRVSSELWGHRRTAHPGNGNTGASGVGVRLANPPYNPKT